jgi:hypothetical protein
LAIFYNQKKQKIQKSVEITELYIKETVNKMLHLMYVYENLFDSKQIGLNKISLLNYMLSKINNKDKIKFTNEEAERLFSKKETEYLNKVFILSDVDFDNLLLFEYRNINSFNELLYSYSDCFEKYYNLKYDSQKRIIIKSMKNNVDNLCDNILDILECISLYFNNDIADKNTAYPSMHKTFLSFVTFFYFKMNNIHYPNIRKIYNDWLEKYNKGI